MFHEEFRQRGIYSVVWLHADRWAPWSLGIDDHSVRRVEEFRRQIARFRYGRKMTLFHRAPLHYRVMDKPTDIAFAAPVDRSGLLPRNESERAKARSAIGELVAHVPVGFGVHLPHKEFHSPNGSKLGADALKLSLDDLRDDTGLPLETWAFIGGPSAFGSDQTEATEVLWRMGGRADFSLPFGQPDHDTLPFDEPFTIWPHRESSELLETEPRLVQAGAGIPPDRVMIWASKVTAASCSLDIRTSFDLKRLRNRENIVRNWLRDCPVIDGTLYVKTHAHSMDVAYFEEGHSVPLCHPDVISLFAVLELACEKAKVELRACIAEEVVERLRCLDAAVGGETSLQERESLILGRAEAVDAAALTSSTADEALELAALKALEVWMGQKAERTGAIGEYYVDKVKQRKLFWPHDRAIAVYCSERFPLDAQYVELGSGVGELPILLSCRGLPSRGLESDQTRFDAASSVLDALRMRFSAHAQPTVVFCQFPNMPTSRPETNGPRVFLCGHVSSSYILDNLDKVLMALQDFDHLVIDVSTFGRRRDGAGIDALVGAVLAKGFIETVRVFSDESSDIRHFRRRLALPSGTAAIRPTTTKSIPESKRIHNSCEGVLGVVGSSYCGSTLLNMMFDSHPDIAGAGELKFLLRTQANTCAFCGENCTVWTRERRAAVTRDNLFDLAASAYGKRFVCDSTKAPSHFVEVAPALSRTPSSLMLLVKHPVRHVSSFLEKARRFQHMATLNDIDAVLKTLLDGYDFAMAKLRLEWIVRYEDLATSPRVALTPVLASLGLNYVPEMDHWVDKSHHHIGGNAGPRFQSARHIKPVGEFLERKYSNEEGIFVDDSYQQVLTAEEVERIAGHPATAEMCRRFGYNDLP